VRNKIQLHVHIVLSECNVSWVHIVEVIESVGEQEVCPQEGPNYRAVCTKFQVTTCVCVCVCVCAAIGTAPESITE